MVVRPMVRGLFVCEQVETAKSSQNISLINIFSSRRVKKVPTEPMSFCVYAGLTGGIGYAMMRVMISGVMDNRLVYSGVHRMRFHDRAMEMRFLLRVNGVVFPSGGRYTVELLADGEWLAQTVITVEE